MLWQPNLESMQAVPGPTCISAKASPISGQRTWRKSDVGAGGVIELPEGWMNWVGEECATAN